MHARMGQMVWQAFIILPALNSLVDCRLPATSGLLCLPGVPPWASVPHVLHLPQIVSQAVTKVHRWHKTHNLKPTDQDSCATLAQQGTPVHAAPDTPGRPIITSPQIKSLLVKTNNQVC